MVFTFLSLKQYGASVEYFDKGEGFYATNMDTTTVKNEYMPTWVKEKPLLRAEQKIEIAKGDGEVQNIVFNNKRISFTLEAKSASVVRINAIYWPGWEATMDGEDTLIHYDNDQGIMNVNVPEGRHYFSLDFFETPIRLTSDIISFVSLITLIFFSFPRRRLEKQM